MTELMLDGRMAVSGIQRCRIIPDLTGCYLHGEAEIPMRYWAMAADCTVIAVNHPDSAPDEVIDDAGFCVEPNADELTDILNRALAGAHPETPPPERAQQYDWDTVAKQAETAYRRAVDGEW